MGGRTSLERAINKADQQVHLLALPPCPPAGQGLLKVEQGHQFCVTKIVIINSFKKHNNKCHKPL